MNVASQMQIEILHWNHLWIATTSGTTFNPKCRSLRWLTQAGECIHTFCSSQSLNQTDGGCTLSLTQRRRRDSRGTISKNIICNLMHKPYTSLYAHPDTMTYFPSGLFFNRSNDFKLIFAFLVPYKFTSIGMRPISSANLDTSFGSWDWAIEISLQRE